MSYTPTEWANGDVITSEKLNKIEGGIEESVDILRFTLTPNVENDGFYNCDKTLAELQEAALAGKTLIGTVVDGVLFTAASFIYSYSISGSDDERTVTFIPPFTFGFAQGQEAGAAIMYVYIWIHLSDDDIWTYYSGTADLTITHAPDLNNAEA